jgi:hypothetical protein
MPRSEHERAVGHLCPDRPDQALGEGVGVRGPDGVWGKETRSVF